VVTPSGERYIRTAGGSVKLGYADLRDVFGYYPVMSCKQTIGLSTGTAPVNTITWQQQLGANFKVALITGDYGQEATWGSTWYSMAAAIAGVDVLADLNSLSLALSNNDYGSAALYGLSLFPVAGAGIKIVKTGVKGTIIGADVVSTGIKAADNMSVVRQLGKEGEEIAGIFNQKTRIPSLSGTASFRVPDELLHDEKILREIKNVSNLSNTSQLRDFNTWAIGNGYQFILEVKPGAKLSGPLQEAIEKGEIILKYIGQ
jgi:hypothetical protein